MTKRLEEVVAKLRKMPAAVQDLAAQRLLHYVNETPEPGDLAAIDEGRSAFARGDYVSLDQWRDEMELGDN